MSGSGKQALQFFRNGLETLLQGKISADQLAGMFVEFLNGDPLKSTATAGGATRANDATLDSPGARKSVSNHLDATHDSGFQLKSASGNTALPYNEQTLDSAAGASTGPARNRRTDPPVRFRIERSHAQGGLGEVFVARDLELDRDVALKEIQTRFHSDSSACGRFEFEARVTGGLEHPCVVPVYGFGYHPDGRPFYAMRFIGGESLKDAIRNYHKRTLEQPSENHTVEFRGLLMRLVAACNGIAFAHSRGVLHRDIKPANIMLGEYGETLVVDWGLAKYIDSREDISVDGTAPTSQVSSNPGVTAHGSMVGTPAFMSPEQAAGKLDEMTPASDIFSLGATLFVILTGKTAFEGLTVGTVITKVKACDFPRPRELHSNVSKPLEAICLKAMARAPAMRYASALDMAADIEHYLAGEPVLAFQEPLLIRCQRWIRKHKTLATAAGVLAVTTAIASMIGMTLVSLEQSRTSAALAQVQTEQVKTRAALTAESEARVQTREALGLITDDLVGQMLARNDRLEASDRRLLVNILAQFEKFTSQSAETQASRGLKADGFRRVGNLQRRLGENQAATEAYTQARNLYQQLVEDFPDQSAYQLDLASVAANQGLMAADGGNYEQAVNSFSESAELFTSLHSREAANVDAAIELARVLGNRANNQERLGKTPLAEADYQAAVEVLRSITPTTRQADWQQEICRISTGYAALLAKDDSRRDDAIASYQQAIDGYQKLTTENANNTQARLEMAATCANLGGLLIRSGKPKPGIEKIEQSVSLSGELAGSFPGFGNYRRQYARSLTQLGKSLIAIDRDRSAKALQQAEQIWRTLAELRPDESQISRDLADTLGAIASLTAASNADGAKETFKDELELRRSLEKINPENLLWADERIITQINYANFLRQSGDAATAIDQYSELLEVLESRDEVNPAWLRAVLFGLGDSSSTAGEYSESLKYWERLTANADDPAWKVFELQRALCLIRTSKTEEGLKVAEQVLAKDEKPDPVILYDVACAYAIACGELRKAAGEDAEIDPKSSSRAIGLLKQAATAGFFKNPAMKTHAATDRDLDALRSLPEFKTFCEQQEIKPPSDF